MVENRLMILGVTAYQDFSTVTILGGSYDIPNSYLPQGFSSETKDQYVLVEQLVETANHQIKNARVRVVRR